MARGLLLSRQDSGVSKNEQQDGGDDSEYANQFDPAMSYEIYGNLEDRYQGLTPPRKTNQVFDIVTSKRANEVSKLWIQTRKLQRPTRAKILSTWQLL